MKIDEVRSKTDSELDFEITNMKRELFDLRFRSATETAANPAPVSAAVGTFGDKRCGSC